MTTFSEANQAKLSLKMQLHLYSWYHSSVVISDGADYAVMISVIKLTDAVRKIIPALYQGVSIQLNQAK